MVHKDLPDLAHNEEARVTKSRMEQVEANTELLSTFVETENTIQEQIDNLQQQIESIRSYNNAVWERVIIKYHPDAKLVEAVTVQLNDKLENLSSKNRASIQHLRNNINHLNEITAKLKKKL